MPREIAESASRAEEIFGKLAIDFFRGAVIQFLSPPKSGKEGGKIPFCFVSSTHEGNGKDQTETRRNEGSSLLPHCRDRWPRPSRRCLHRATGHLRPGEGQGELQDRSRQGRRVDRKGRPAVRDGSQSHEEGAPGFGLKAVYRISMGRGCRRACPLFFTRQPTWNPSSPSRNSSNTSSPA